MLSYLPNKSFILDEKMTTDIGFTRRFQLTFNLDCLYLLHRKRYYIIIDFIILNISVLVPVPHTFLRKVKLSTMHDPKMAQKYFRLLKDNELIMPT